MVFCILSDNFSERLVLESTVSDISISFKVFIPCIHYIPPHPKPRTLNVHKKAYALNPKKKKKK